VGGPHYAEEKRNRKVQGKTVTGLGPLPATPPFPVTTGDVDHTARSARSTARPGPFLARFSAYSRAGVIG
jgi:hypothetical protein